MMGSLKTALIIPDCHIPYEDERAYNLMLDVAKDLSPNEIVIIGDYADFYNVSSFGKSPGIYDTLQDEIAAVHERLKQLKDLFPKAKKVFLQGNHEYRLERFVNSNAKEFFGLITTQSLLELDRFGFDYIPYGPNQLYQVLGSKLYARHEPLTTGLHVAHGTVSKALKSVIFGHVHRLQESGIVAINGEEYRGISCGWLGDKKHEVFNYVKAHHQWNLGFCIITVLNNGLWFSDLTHIMDYKCVANGFLYEG